jgi:hypothetical protein
MAWKITLPSGTEYTQSNVTAGQFTTVAELLVDAKWETIEPTIGPRQLVAWIAILMASEDSEDEVANHLVEVMGMPMMQVLAMLNVDEE